MNQNPAADSAGVPWAGRSFEENQWSNDDGSTPEKLEIALGNFQRGESLSQLVTALANSRLIIPLVAQLGEAELGPHGQLVDKSAELAIVAVQTMDDKSAIPVFSSVQELSLWRADARPVPVESGRAALAAITEGHNRLVLNPASIAIGLRTPALRAIATNKPWIPAYENARVHELVASTAIHFSEITGFQIRSGDPSHKFTGPEIQIELELVGGLDSAQLGALVVEFSSKLQTQEFLQLVDSLGIKLKG